MECTEPRVAIKDDEAKLVEAVRHHIRVRTGKVIGIDGARDAGKTCLAKRLGSHTGAHVVHLDDYLDDPMFGESGQYVASIEYDRLYGRFWEDVKSEGPVIVEGICLRDVLDRAGIRPGLLIYVQRVSPNGCAQNLWEISDDISLEEALAEIVGNSAGAKLDREIVHYYKRVKPRDDADILYEGIEKIL